MGYIETKIKGLKFKETTEEDIPAILEFIKKIAVYEKMLDQVVATEETLKESIFQNNRAHALLVEFNDKVIGYIIYFFNFSTFIGKAGLYLEDIYIDPEYRGNGIGKEAFATLIHIAKEEKCERMEWVCLDWNEPSLNFYESIGAKQMKEWIIHRLDKEAIQKIDKYGL
ncbi:GNAT family N-acetyltransferase [Clostridium botulinum]|uniref:GNAT family N-acetyltransferase n=1 Tax=Clostridium botulinum TaxID=1491 RepID=A0A0C2S3K3_CLOBO|nr:MULTISPECIES: GNAT family N-acetyltransferase [Clostridium]ACD53148.1 diamine acetyltransferase 1 [Clostridium botulinum E3 str. Alaska E43]AJF30466.1 GNAT family acetyltransferase [Clostridium botulinum]AJF33529.1 GNAT family acetyltransferase [Clostridium botulinum]KAI3346661.1 GNAT family N-acetyltransferase [Clostridium botulinum]KIL07707.1 GNAT family acetyltransferase [Clostridium botulinum]